jgi:hypothetical protein
LWRGEPTILLTNQQTATSKVLLTRYAQRMYECYTLLTKGLDVLFALEGPGERQDD